MSHAIHAGLQRAGLKAKLEFANEIRPELLEHASEFNDAWSGDTVPLAAPMQELAFDDRGLAHVPKVEILEAGIPCSGASRAGTAKRGLKHPEAHPEVGHLVVAALVILNKAAPAIVTIENVPTYATSASASILRSQLRDLGYTTHERILNGKEWGAIEGRDRWCMVAVTQGIDFDFEQLMPPKAMRQVIGDLLEDIPPEDARWGTMKGLVEKEARDLAAGKNFKMQVYTADEESVGTITKGYAKVRSTDPKLRHPDNPSLMRQFTSVEHARFKQVPEHLLGDASETLKHEMLGQSVIYKKFEDVGHHIGNSVNRFAGLPEVEIRNRAARSFEEQLGVDQDVAQLAANVVADLRRAELGDSRYVGPIVAVRQDLIVQKIDDVTGVLHQAVSLREMPKLGQAVEIRYCDGSAVVMAATNTAGLPAPASTDSPAVRSAKERLRAENERPIPDDYNAFDTLPKSTRLRM
ncbi:DNA cytosine methyltransferase [Cupriavidus basilensis]